MSLLPTEHVEQLADSIIARMKREHHVFWVDPEQHTAQHDFIAILMQERADKIARRKRIEEKIAGSVLLSALMLCIGLLGAGALAWLRGSGSP